MSKKFIDNQLISYFQNRESFSREELLNFYRRFEDLNEGTFGWRIYDLKKKQIIKSVKQGVYSLVYKPLFKPELDDILVKTGDIMETSLDHINYNIWKTSWLNEFIELQAVSFLTILEVDRDSMERVFYNLKDHNYLNLFIKPDEKSIGHYISEIQESFIIKPMISRAPTQRIRKVVVPTLEKILVDLYCDEKIFYAYQGSALIKVYQSAFEKYSLNYSKLFSYAKRRKREDGIKEFLLENLGDKIKDLIE